MTTRAIPLAHARVGGGVTILALSVLLLASCSDNDPSGVAEPVPEAPTETDKTPEPVPEPSGEPAVGPDPADDGVDDADHAVRSIEIPVGAFTFDALEAGPADGELVLLLHGFPQTGDMWRSQIDALSERGYRVVAPNQRGYSSRARPDAVEDYSRDRLAEDVIGMVDALGHERFHLVGHDWGGTVAWEVAARHPDRLDSVTAVSTPHTEALLAAIDDPELDQGERSSYVDTLAEEGSEALFLADDAAMLRSLYRDAGLTEEEMQPQLDVLNDPDAMRAALHWYRAWVVGGPATGPSTVPTLYVWSDGDPALGPDAAAATVDYVTGPYRFETLEGVNHWIPERAADELNQLLLEFLSDPNPAHSEPASAAGDVACIEEVALSTAEVVPGSPMSAADRLVVTSVTDDGCAPLDGPLVALNWRSFDDPASYQRYEQAIVPILDSRGHMTVMSDATTVEVLESPAGTPPTGGAYVHEGLAFPVYTSAEGFLEMLLSPEYQQIVSSQQDGARQSDYIWGLQQCLVGCQNLGGPAPLGTYVLHIFGQPEGALAETMAALVDAASGPNVFYGGELVATMRLDIGDELVSTYALPWGNGTLVYRVESVDEARELLNDPALQEFRNGTTDDLLVVLEERPLSEQHRGP